MPYAPHVAGREALLSGDDHPRTPARSGGPRHGSGAAGARSCPCPLACPSMPPHRVGGLARARQLVDSARCVTVLTGAGISTDSGIPDFRGPQGVWTKDPAAERLSTLRAYLDDPEVRRHAWRVRLASPAWTARPNAGHRALVDLERSGKLDVLVTQNIDGLHQLAGNEPGRVIEIHGTLRDVVCLSCGDRGPTEPTLARVRAGEEDPACLRCGGILRLS